MTNITHKHNRIIISDWSFLCEGNLNYVYRFHSTSMEGKQWSDFYGHVLKISKNIDCQENFIISLQAYKKNVIIPWFTEIYNNNNTSEHDESKVILIHTDIVNTLRKNASILSKSSLFQRNRLHMKYQHIIASDEIKIESTAVEICSSIIESSKQLVEGSHLESVVLEPDLNFVSKPLNLDFKKPTNSWILNFEDDRHFSLSGTDTPAPAPAPAPAPTATRHENTISVEIKVKCGLISLSPLIRPQNIIKRKFCRYHIMEAYKSSLLLSSNLKSNDDLIINCKKNISSQDFYHPSDICSGDINRINKAVHSLMTLSNCNIKLSLDGNHIYGWDTRGNEDIYILVNSILKSFGISHSSHSLSEVLRINILDLFTKQISYILEKEIVCMDIQLMQGLDLLDIEGISHVYNRLIDIHLQDENKANLTITKSLETFVILPQLKQLASVLIKHRSPKTEINKNTKERNNNKIKNYNENSILKELNSNHFYLIQFLKEFYPKLFELLEIIDFQAGSVENNREHEIHAVLALKWVSSLEESDCLFFIHLWLAALAASDMSVIVALHCVPQSTFENVLMFENCLLILSPALWRWEARVLREQSASNAGVMELVAISMDDDTVRGGALQFVYSVNITDIGPKKIDKIKIKNKQEDLICEIAGKYLESFPLTENIS